MTPAEFATALANHLAANGGGGWAYEIAAAMKLEARSITARMQDHARHVVETLLAPCWRPGIESARRRTWVRLRGSTVMPPTRDAAVASTVPERQPKCVICSSRYQRHLGRMHTCSDGCETTRVELSRSRWPAPDYRRPARASGGRAGASATVRP